MIIHDAATAFVTIIDAAFAWVETLAVAAAFTLCVVGLAAAPLFAPTTPRSIRRPTARRHVPHWARTDRHDDYQEAA